MRKSEMYEKEIFYIQQYNSYKKNDKGYNMTLGGDGTHGYVFTKADKKKISQRQKAYYENNPEARQKTSERSIKYYSIC